MDPPLINGPRQYRAAWSSRARAWDPHAIALESPLHAFPTIIYASSMMVVPPTIIFNPLYLAALLASYFRSFVYMAGVPPVVHVFTTMGTVPSPLAQVFSSLLPHSPPPGSSPTLLACPMRSWSFTLGKTIRFFQISTLGVSFACRVMAAMFKADTAGCHFTALATLVQSQTPPFQENDNICNAEVESHSKVAQSPPFQEDDDIDDYGDGDSSARGLTGTSIVSRAAAQGLWGEEGSAAAGPDSIMEVGQIWFWNMAPIPHPGLDAVLIPYSPASMIHAYAPLENT